MSYSLAEKLYANKPYTQPPADVLGLKVEFRTIGASEEVEIARSAASGTYLEFLQARQIPTLARAIRSLDGVEWKDFDEIKQRLRSNSETTLAQAVEAELRKPEYTQEVVAALFVAYADFQSGHRNAMEALKKSSAPTNPVTVG